MKRTIMNDEHECLRLRGGTGEVMKTILSKDLGL